MTCSYQWNTDRGMIRQWSDHDPTLTWASAPRVFSNFFSPLQNAICVSKRSVSRFVYFKKFTTCCACHEKWCPQYQNVLRLPELMTLMQNLPQTWNAHYNGQNITSHFPTLSNILPATKIAFMLHLRRTWNAKCKLLFSLHLYYFSFWFSSLLYSALPFFSNNKLFFVFFVVFVSLPYFLFSPVYFFFLDCARMFVYRKYSKYSKETSFD